MNCHFCFMIGFFCFYGMENAKNEQFCGDTQIRSQYKKQNENDLNSYIPTKG